MNRPSTAKARQLINNVRDPGIHVEQKKIPQVNAISESKS